MAEPFSVEEILRKAREQTGATAPRTDPMAPLDIPPSGPFPTTQAGRPVPRTWEQRNARPDVPLVTDEQADVDPQRPELTEVVKTNVILRRRPQDKVSYLEEFYGPGNVRLADDQTPIVQVFDEQGKPREMPFMGSGISDLAEHFKAAAPEMIGGLGGLVLGSRLAGAARPIAQYAAKIIGAATGQAAGGAVSDVAVSTAPLSEIALQRTKEIPVNAAIDVGLTGLGKISGRVLSPMGGQVGEMEANAIKARAYFKDKFNVDYPMTPGEQIASSLLRRVEGVLFKSPGASKAFDELKRRQIDAFVEIQNKMLASKLDPADVGMLRLLEEDVGEGAIAGLLTKIDPIKGAEVAAKNQAIKAANDAVLEEVAQSTGPMRELHKEKVIGSIRTRAAADRDAFRAESDNRYSQAYAITGGTEKILGVKQLGQQADEMRKKLPAVEHTVTEPTGLVTASGQPILTTGQVETQMRALIPGEVRSVLDQLAALKGMKDPTMSLRDLVRMRTNVSDRIAEATALVDVDTKDLIGVRNLLTKTIEDETGKLPGGALKSAWERANKFYREGDAGFAKGRSAFEDQTVARLFRPRESGGFVADEDMFKQIDSAEYAALKNFLGPRSPEFQSLQRAMVDDLLVHSQRQGSDILDGQKLGARLEGFLADRRSIAEDILGEDKVRRLQGIGQMMQKLDPGGQIDAREFAAILNGNQPLKQAVGEAVARQKELNQIYRSQILKDIADGKLGRTFDATEFVDRFYKDASPKELDSIKKMLKTDFPESWEQLQRKVAERMLFDASEIGVGAVRGKAGEPIKIGSSAKMEEILGSEQNRERLKIILEDGYEDFVQMASMLRSGQTVQQAFSAAGGIRAGMQISGMFDSPRGALGYASDVVKQKFGVIVYFSPAIRKLITNQMFRSPEGQAAMLRTMIASEPFVEEVTKQMGFDSQRFITELLNSVGAYEEQGPAMGAARRPSGQATESILSRARQQATNQPSPRIFPAQPR